MTYPAPVDQLRRLGEPTYGDDWPEYPRRYGLGPEHVPDLIRMATDPALNQADSESPDVWAPLHAWRALGQLHAAEAAEPLLRLLLEREPDDDWVREDVPRAVGMLGPAALPAIEAALADTTREEATRIAVADSLRYLADVYPEARSECVAALVRQLERAEQNGREYNGWLTGLLLDLEAVEAAPALERAFAAGLVDPSIAGDWDRVRWELGLSDQPPPSLQAMWDRGRYGEGAGPGDTHRGPSPKAKAAARRKQAKKERQRQRKHR
jgi:hypothetical protein